MGHFKKGTKTKTPGLEAWILDSYVVLFLELQNVSDPDLFSAARTSKKYFPSFLNQPGYMYSLSMYSTWT